MGHYDKYHYVRYLVIMGILIILIRFNIGVRRYSSSLL